MSHDSVGTSMFLFLIQYKLKLQWSLKMWNLDLVEWDTSCAHSVLRFCDHGMCASPEKVKNFKGSSSFEVQVDLC